MMNTNEWLQANIDMCNDRTAKMVNYLLLKVDEQDWHGVADAAMDIRELQAARDAYLATLKEINKDA